MAQAGAGFAGIAGCWPSRRAQRLNSAKVVKFDLCFPGGVFVALLLGEPGLVLMGDASRSARAARVECGRNGEWVGCGASLSVLTGSKPATRDGGSSWDYRILENIPDPDPTGSLFDHTLTTL